jgi:hypothetical protein
VVAPRFAEINANMTKNAKERAEAQLREAKQDLEHWRSKVCNGRGVIFHYKYGNFNGDFSDDYCCM